MVIEPGGTLWIALLGVHILAGVIALVAGAAAIITAKGQRRHNQAGRYYVYSMAVVVVTAVPLAAITANWFLLAIAVFSGYLVFGGYRVIRRQRARLTSPTVVDYGGHGAMLSVGGVMIAVGGWQTVNGTGELAPVLVVFGAIGAALAVREGRSLHRDQRTPWMQRHIAFMGGAYIATVTATITVNLTMVPPLVRWLGPTAVGVPLIWLAIARYTR